MQPGRITHPPDESAVAHNPPSIEFLLHCSSFPPVRQMLVPEEGAKWCPSKQGRTPRHTSWSGLPALNIGKEAAVTQRPRGSSKEWLQPQTAYIVNLPGTPRPMFSNTGKALLFTQVFFLIKAQEARESLRSKSWCSSPFLKSNGLHRKTCF